MNPSTAQLTTLVEKVTQIRDRNAELRRLKGENFNLFTILGLETAENKTHSAFLGALLDPRGSHGLGAELLKAFLATIGYKGHLQADKATLTLEKHIGFRDEVAKTGGRIDLYLQDTAGHSIAIENKFYAGDQYAQLERYAKHNQDKTTVYYLNLDGSEPSEESKGTLEAGIGYHPISYRDHILRWLNTCIGLAADQPILRETIKQYRILIQKHTGQLSDASMNTEIHNLIAHNYEAAKLIQQSVGEVELERIRTFMHLVKEKITAILQHDSTWSVHIDADIFAQDAGIRIRNTEWGDIQVSLIGWRRVASAPTKYGINAWDKWWDRNDVVQRLSEVSKSWEGFQSNEWFPYFKLLLFFNDPAYRARLFVDDRGAAWAQAVADEVADFAVLCQVPLKGIQRIPGS